MRLDFLQYNIKVQKVPQRIAPLVLVQEEEEEKGRMESSSSCV